ncbi:hypothetical protein [Microbacterium karelineae]|uniref:hypothetical protein n=1 Tax=Microbacterium karelineae TaxID=2654283 RepID=UPI0012EAC1B8|nr:hypothetical protein [Microbacterium karelineae]
MASFATPQDMQNRTQGAIAATHPFLQTELDAATRAIRDHCGWHIAPNEQKTFRRTSPWPERVWLPAMRITSIDAVTIDGATISPATVGFDPDSGWTSLRGCTAEVTFTAGFASVPESILTLTLAIAAGGLGAPLGQTREQAGGVALTFGRAGGALQTAPGSSDVATLAPYTIGYVP